MFCWLSFDFGDRMYFASDYFPQLYTYVEQLIELGKAYVCPLDEEAMRAHRGTVTEPGRPRPGTSAHDRENLDLSAHARGRIRRWDLHLARESTWRRRT